MTRVLLSTTIAISVAIGGLAVRGVALCQEPSASKEPARPSDSRQVIHSFSHVSIAPDGQSVVWSQGERGNDTAGNAESAIFLANLRSGTGQRQRITVAVGKGRSANGHDPVWSPDGSRLAFVSAAAKKGQQIYVMPRSGRPKQLTHLGFEISALRWSPDGKFISYLFIENPPRSAGPTSAVPTQTGVIGQTAFAQRIGIVEVASGQTRKVSPPDLYVYEYAWSPDSRTLAAIAAHPPGDDNWYVAQLYTLALQSGPTTSAPPTSGPSKSGPPTTSGPPTSGPPKSGPPTSGPQTLAGQSGAMQSILKTSMQIAGPCWSPDGKSIAFIGGLMSDEGVIGGDVFCVPATGGTLQNLTPGLKASAAWLDWLPSGRILFTEHVDGGSGIGSVDPASGRVESLWTAAESIGAGFSNGISVARDGQTTALVRQSFERPPEIDVGPIGSWRPLTHANAHVTPQWGKAQSLHWKSDAFTVQGWLLFPKDYDEKRRYPMVVMPHGGPASLYKPSFASSRFFHPTVFSQRGYFVFLPNPRGSYGQGEGFTRGNVKDFGHGDLRDILSGIDEVLKTFPVDKDRLAIAGWSYGGYMTMWTVTQTHRFRAAVAGAGVANWQSYYGENGIDQWMIPYFGASVYDDPAVYAKSSPINFIKQVKTPTLVIVGEYDVECPLPQSQEFWHGLKTCGVPTE
ncbi:MAG TPA: prolyl oligopeptidase family serine peptidase, partial [Planctomycetaceae bacterium]|nr:prolyl oligopeptidase family serine peptidase [Planctomycetaceae bacterium]